MNRESNSLWVLVLLLCAWLLVVAWQMTEHRRVTETAKSDLRNRSHEIAGTLSAVTRALRFRGAIFQERLEPVLNELARVRTNALVATSPLLALGLLNNDGDVVVAAGQTNLLERESGMETERWSAATVVFVLPVEGASVNPEGQTNNATVVLPTFHMLTNSFGHDGRFDGRKFDGTNPPPTNAGGQFENPPPPPDEGESLPAKIRRRFPHHFRSRGRSQRRAACAALLGNQILAD